MSPSAPRIWGLALAVALAAGSARGAPPAPWSPERAVAPSADDLGEAVVELERRLAHAEVVHDALGTLQNALADEVGFGARIDCADPSVRSLVARVRAFGQAHRDAAQSARVQRTRLDGIAGSETVRALVLGERAEALDALRTRTDLEIRRQREAASWQWHRIEQRDGIERCASALEEAAGLPGWRTDEHPVAVWVLGDGVQIRSSAQHAAGAVVRGR